MTKFTQFQICSYPFVLLKERKGISRPNTETYFCGTL